MKKRKWCWIMKPHAYCMTCDICGGNNITWSEYERMIWCYDCQKDTPGQGSIFDGPILLNFCLMMGISFDRVDLKTDRRLYLHVLGDRLVWRKKKPVARQELENGR